MAEQCACTDEETLLVERVMDSLGSDLAMLIDREIAFDVVGVEHLARRPAGEGSIHISFKVDFWLAGKAEQGCLLMALADATRLAALLLGTPCDEIESRRDDQALDPTLKSAIVEVGNMICGSVGSALRSLSFEHDARFAGCQGVRAGVRPALVYRENAPLTVGRARMSLAEFPPSDVILILPILR